MIRARLLRFDEARRNEAFDVMVHGPVGHREDLAQFPHAKTGLVHDRDGHAVACGLAYQTRRLAARGVLRLAASCRRRLTGA